MKLAGILITFVSLSLVAGLTACKKEAGPSEQNLQDAPAQASQLAAGGTMPTGISKSFTGTIGETLELQMKLVREGDRVTGSYFYRKVGTPIAISGTVDKNGQVLIEEFDTGGKQTGAFKGTWKEDEEGLIVISGNWTKPNGDKKTAFSLHEEPIEFSSGVEIVSRRIKENNRKLKYEIDAEYPQLIGSGSAGYEKFNQTVRGLITKMVSGFKEEMAPSEDDPEPTGLAESMNSDLHVGYSIVLAKDDLISVHMVVGTYSAGAAHPNSHSEDVNFDLQKGKLLRMGDLFQPGSRYLQTIAAYCIAELKKRKGEDADRDWVERGAGPDAENYSNWTIGKKGLGITFDAYQVASYAEGPQHVLVPYSVVKSMVKADGPIAQFVK